MISIITIAFALAMLVTNASAQEAPTDYRSVLRQCGTDWRASDQRKATPKGEGMQAWQTFRRDCVSKSGYVAKRDRKVSTTN